MNSLYYVVENAALKIPLVRLSLEPKIKSLHMYVASTKGGSIKLDSSEQADFCKSIYMFVCTLFGGDTDQYYPDSVAYRECVRMD